MRKISIISGIVIFVTVAIILGIRHFPDSDQPVIQTFSTKQNPAFKAVPQKSPLLIEVKNQEGFFNALKGDNPVMAELRGMPEFENIFSNISHFRDFISSRPGISTLLKSKSVIISVNPSGKNQLTNLFLIQFNDQDESNSATEVILRELGTAYSISRRNYDNTSIFNVKSDNLKFYFACSNDIFLASEDFIIIEEAIRQMKSMNLLSNKEFTETYKTIEETALANIFINHQTIHQVLGKFLSPEIRKNISEIANFSNWTGLDFTENSKHLEFSGYSVTKDSSDNYLNIFRNQEAQELTIDQVIPSNASFFVALNLKNTRTFLDHYETYIKANGLFYQREMNLIKFQRETRTDPLKLIKELGGTQFAGVYTTINKSNTSQNRFFIAELTDRSDAMDILGKAVSEFSRTSKVVEEKLHTKYTLNSKNSFDIYSLPIGNMAGSLFGRAFSGIHAEFFVMYDKYLICGDNLTGLKDYLQNLVSKQTMANDSVYQVYTKSGQPKPNFYLYAKIPKVFRLKNELLKTETSVLLSENEDIIRKFSAFSWQFSVSDKMIRNSVSLKYDPNLKEDPEAIWQLKLDGQLAQKPKFVLNHRDLPNRELIVSDNQNNIYLISKDGIILWKLNLSEEIISEIHQIDIYHNKRFQYLFNTKTQLFIVDREGNLVGKYPASLKSNATNGVSIAEYGKNKEYRFFVAGEDNRVYVYDRDGKQISGWNPEAAQSRITDPIRHLEIEGKDYIVYSDKQNTYFLDRQGRSRDIRPAPFERSANQMFYIQEDNPRLISTDQSGYIHTQDFTGQAELREVGKYTAGHRFSAEDLDGNGSPEFLFAEGKKLTVYTSEGKKLFERSFSGDISETPFVCSFGSEINKIGVVVEAENKVYLLDKNGNETRGFPLSGNSAFILGKFNDATVWQNLIVGAPGNLLVNYRIE